MEVLRGNKLKNVTTKEKRKSSVNPAANIKTNIKKPCLPCPKSCVCETINYHESNANVPTDFFVKDRCLCNRHDRGIDIENNKEKEKYNLLSSSEFYKCVYYSELLKKAESEIRFCDHEDHSRLYRRLENLVNDYESACLRMEGKEAKEGN